ncbi:hypothetical protein ACFU6I_48615 [Streptomyces sp. NPDC057486]
MVWPTTSAPPDARAVTEGSGLVRARRAATFDACELLAVQDL